MKFLKFSRLAITTLSVLFITACSDSSTETVIKEDTEDTTIQKKHESIELPVDIYVKENYYPGENVTFIRTIESVEISDFTENTAIEFEDRYDNKFRQMNLDLINDFKRVVISMSHTIEGKTSKTPFEAFVLDKGSVLHFNAKPIMNEIVAQQIKQSTLDYRMGKTHNKKGEIILAIPKGYFKGNLQLETIVRKKDDNEIIYVDLN